MAIRKSILSVVSDIGKVRRGFRQHIGGVGDDGTAAGRGLDVDVIEAHGNRGQDSHGRRQKCDALGVEAIRRRA